MYKIKQLPEDFRVTEISDVPLSDTGRYAYFLMRKKELSTLEAVQRIAFAVYAKHKVIGCAGQKDKHATTEQLISVPTALKTRMEQLDLDNISLTFQGCGDEPVYPGRLKGNSFVIIIRNCTLEEAQKAAGFGERLVPNYFDDQRFGSNNCEIGRKLVRREFSDAASLAAQSESRINGSPGEPIRFLKQSPVLKFYIHAYQSWLFNELVKSLVMQSGAPNYMCGYSLGEMLFPLENLKNRYIPIPGIGTELKDPAVKGLLDGLFASEGITARSFIIREIPELSSFGERRRFLVKPNGYSAVIGDDEINPGMKMATLSFKLRKGSYATIVIKAVMSQPSAK